MTSGLQNQLASIPCDICCGERISYGYAQKVKMLIPDIKMNINCTQDAIYFPYLFYEWHRVRGVAKRIFNANIHGLNPSTDCVVIVFGT